MTQAEQEQHLLDARTYLSVVPSITIDRCRHATIDQTSLWFFHGGKQIASATRFDDSKWRCSFLQHGQPISLRKCDTLLDVIEYIMSFDRPRGV